MTKEFIEIEKEQIQKVESFKYLGLTVKMLEDTRDEILIKTNAGLRCLRINKTSYVRVRCFNTKKEDSQSIRATYTMTYGCETWNIHNFGNKLVTAQHAVERKWLQITPGKLRYKTSQELRNSKQNQNQRHRRKK